MSMSGAIRNPRKVPAHNLNGHSLRHNLKNRKCNQWITGARAGLSPAVSPCTSALWLLITVVSATAPSRADITITRDEGGLKHIYEQRVAVARVAGERVIIDGVCASACTLYLTLPAGQVCATPLGAVQRDRDMCQAAAATDPRLHAGRIDREQPLGLCRDGKSDAMIGRRVEHEHCTLAQLVPRCQ